MQQRAQAQRAAMCGSSVSAAYGSMQLRAAAARSQHACSSEHSMSQRFGACCCSVLQRVAASRQRAAARRV